MKGKIVKTDGNKITIRPLENFLDIIIKNRAYNTINDSYGNEITIRPLENFLDIIIKNRAYNTINDSYIGKEVDIKFELHKFVVVNVDGIGFYGEMNYEVERIF